MERSSQAAGRSKRSPKQTEILEYLKSQILEKGYPPSVREICDAVNLKSTSSVHSHLAALEHAGYIRRDATKPRAIEICDPSFQILRTMPNTGAYTLKVRGDNMQDSGILNGDTIFVQPAERAQPGDPVVTGVDGGLATVEYYDPSLRIQGKVSGVYRQYA